MKIFWLYIDKLKYKDFLNEISKLETQNIVFTPNPEILLKTKSDPEFKSLVKQATYLTPDGIGLYIAFQILDWKNIFAAFYNLFFHKQDLYKKYGERICWSDLTKDLLYLAQEKNISVTILDLYNPTDTKKVASQELFSQKLKEVFPDLKFNYFIYNPEKEVIIKEHIKNSDSQILFSTLGMKKQEKSVIEIMDYAKNIKLWLGIWSSFDYFTGYQKRAPNIMRKLGLEWLYRIFTSPNKFNRLKRIFNAIFVFTYHVLKERK